MGNVSGFDGAAFPVSAILGNVRKNKDDRRMKRMSILEVNGLKKVYTTRFGGNKVEAPET